MTALAEAFFTTPFAHRGFHDMAAGRVENSVAAVKAAVAAGYGVEIDIRPAAGGTPMVFHDATLDRLTGETGPVTAHGAGALGAIRLSGGSEGIPTLPDVLGIVGGQVPLLIEIKSQPDPAPLSRAVVKALEGYAGPVALMSFNPRAVAACAEVAPDIPRGLTTAAFRADDFPDLDAPTRAHLAAIADYEGVGACFISHEAADLGAPRVADLKAGGAAVFCWTIRSQEAADTALEIADNITFEGFAPRLDGPFARAT